MPAKTKGKRYKHSVKLVMPAQAQLNADAEQVCKAIEFKQALRKLKQSRTDTDYVYKKAKQYAQRNHVANGVKRDKCIEHHYSTRKLFKWEKEELEGVDETKPVKRTERECCILIHNNQAYLEQTSVTHQTDEDGRTQHTLRSKQLEGRYTVEPVANALNNRTLALMVLKCPKLKIYRVISPTQESA